MTRERRHESADLAEELARPVAPDDTADAPSTRATTGPTCPTSRCSTTRSSTPTEVKPTWRGWIHAGTFPVTIAGGRRAHRARRGRAGEVGVGGLHAHVDAAVRQSRRSTTASTGAARQGRSSSASTTPTSSCSSRAPTRRSRSSRCRPTRAGVLLAVVWGGALLGIGFRVFWITAPRWLYVPLYLLLGWAAVMYLGDLLDGERRHDGARDRRRPALHGRRDRLRPQEAEPVARASSGSTRSSTRARCSRSCATGPRRSSSRWTRCTTWAEHVGVGQRAGGRSSSSSVPRRHPARAVHPRHPVPRRRPRARAPPARVARPRAARAPRRGS